MSCALPFGPPRKSHSTGTSKASTTRCKREPVTRFKPFRILHLLEGDANRFAQLLLRHPRGDACDLDLLADVIIHRLHALGAGHFNRLMLLVACRGIRAWGAPQPRDGADGPAKCADDGAAAGTQSSTQTLGPQRQHPAHRQHGQGKVTDILPDTRPMPGEAASIFPDCLWHGDESANWLGWDGWMEPTMTQRRATRMQANATDGAHSGMDEKGLSPLCWSKE